MVVYKVFNKNLDELVGLLIERRKDMRGETQIESAMKWAKLAFGRIVKDEKTIRVVPYELKLEINTKSIIEKGIFTKEEILGMGKLFDEELRGERRIRNMIAYEFYWRDPIKGYQPIGGLPERRKNPERRTQESVINLARRLLGDNKDISNVYFITTTKDENTGKLLRLDSVYRPLKEYFKDKRRYPRISVDFPIEYWVKYDGPAHGGIVVDASETGFLIYSTEEIPLGTKLKIAVLFPKEYELEIFEVFAEIIWQKANVKKGEEGYQYGLRLIQFVEEDHWKLRGLLSGRFK